VKFTALLGAIILYANVTAQSGVYLTVDDFLNHKLSVEGKTLKIPSGPGEDNRVVVATAEGNKTFLFTEIWGFQNGLSEYRMLKGKPYLIACKGEYYVFTQYGPIRQKRDKIIYYRNQVGFGEINLTKDLHNETLTTLTDYADLWAMFDAKTVAELKDAYIKLLANNEGADVIPEQIIDHYNSTRKGYIPPVYSHIELRSWE
jgi:hypothetical protein